MLLGLFVLLFVLLFPVHSQLPCATLPPLKPYSYLNAGNCTAPAPDGATCTLGCAPLTLPYDNVETCKNGSWLASSPGCYIPNKNNTDKDGVLYAFNYQGSITNAGDLTNVTKLWPISGPALFLPFGIVIRMRVTVGPQPELALLTPRLSVSLGDIWGRLGTVNVDWPSMSGSAIACYQGDALLARLAGSSYNASFDYGGPNFVEWPYQLIATTTILDIPNTQKNYSVDLTWLDARLLVGHTKTFVVSSETNGVAFFLVEPLYVDIDTAPLELTFRSDDDTPVLIVLAEQDSGLCTADVNYFQSIVSSNDDEHKAATLATKTASVYAKFIITPTSAPQLHYFKYNNVTGKATGRYFVGVYFFGPSGNATSKIYTLSLTQGAPYSLTTENLCFIIFFPLGAVIVQMIQSYFNLISCMCPKYNCGLAPPLAKGNSRFKSVRNLCHYWFSGPTARPYSFVWWAAVVGAIFGVSSYQVVIGRYTDSIDNGNLDLCYYNEACFRPTYGIPIPLNQIVSNIAFVIMGVGFVIHVAHVEMTKRAGHDHTVFYALGLCLIGEGFFSGLYHICPAPNIFQFDTAFMFLISSLLLIAVYQTTEVEEGIDPPQRFKAAKIFLLFMAPLLIFNYVGTTIDNGLGVNDPIAYWFFVVLWEIMGFSIIAAKWYGAPRAHEAEIALQQKWGWWKWLMGPGFFFCLVVFVLGFTIGNAVTKAFPIASMFLYICVAVSLLTVLRIGAVRADLSKGRIFLLGVMSTLTLIFWIVALRYFGMDVTNKALSPWESRALNKDCEILNYYDSHDVWHIIASVALSFTVVLVLHINPPNNEHGDVFIELRPYLSQQQDDTDGDKAEGTTEMGVEE